VADGGQRRAELVEEHAGGAFEQAAAQTDASETTDDSGLVSEPGEDVGGSAGGDGADGDGADETDADAADGDEDDADEDQSGLTDFM